MNEDDDIVKVKLCKGKREKQRSNQSEKGKET